MAGKLYIVSTPIGNLNDISKRALEVLSDANTIAAEDSRITSRLLNHYNIKNKIISYNNFNENTKFEYLLNLLKDNLNIALVSNAGTPSISDPGYRIVNGAIKEGIEVISIPGASSVTSALSISGIPSDKFYFEGFLPKKKGRQKRLENLRTLDCTIVIFESPNRLVKTLFDIEEKLGNRVVSICKELTKIHESVTVGYVKDIKKSFSDSIKGEHIILIAKEGYCI